MRTFSLAAANLLEQLVASGVRLRVVADELQVSGVDDAQREQIREHKDELKKLVVAGDHRWQKVMEWKFTLADVPRLDGNGVDCWMVGTRLGKPGAFQFWFAGTRKRQ